MSMVRLGVQRFRDRALGTHDRMELDGMFCFSLRPDTFSLEKFSGGEGGDGVGIALLNCYLRCRGSHASGFAIYTPN